MKKIVFTILLVFASVTMFAQEKGLHITLNGNAAATKFLYDLDGGKSLFGVNTKYQQKNLFLSNWGYGVGLGVQYFFTEQLGLSLGLDWSVFKTKSYLKDKKFDFPNMLDDEDSLCNVTTRLLNRVELQTTHFLDIPLMFRYQYKWGRKEMNGFYLAAGLKLQLPLSSKFEKAAGDVNVSAFYPETGVTYPHPDDVNGLPQIGYATSGVKEWNGKNQLKPGLSVVGEAGFLIGLSRRVDMNIGVSAEYGFLNVKKANNNLLAVIPEKTPQDGQIADFLDHNGVINSNLTSAKINPLAFKLNVGIRIKLGKLKERIIDEIKISSGSMLNDTAVLRELIDYLKGIENNGPHRDTIIINPIIYYNNEQYPNNTPYTRNNQKEEVQSNPYYRNNVETETRPNLQEENYLLEPIFFDLNSSDLNPESIGILNKKIELMQKYPNAVLFVIGHTCDLASDPYNDKLSLRRAEVARNYIISKGIGAKRIEIVPMGKKDPSYPNLSEDLRKMNRRDDFYLFMNNKKE